MNTFLEFYPGDTLALLAINVLLQVTAIGVAAWVVERLFLRRNPAAAHTVWLFALISVLLSPLLSVVIDPPSPPLFTIPLAGEVRDQSASHDPGRPLEGITASPARHAGRAAGFSPPMPEALRAASGALVFFWALGVVFCSLRLAHGLWTLRRLGGREDGPDDGSWKEVGAEVQRILGLASLPQVVISETSGPVTVGLWRRHVILPKRLLETLEAAELRSVLLHEFAHVLRRDHLVGLLQRIAGILFWLHPLVHLVNARLSRRREEICDNHVICVHDCESYAETLLALSETYQPLRPRLIALGLLQDSWRLEERVAGLLDDRRSTLTKPHGAAVGLVGVAFVAIALLFARTSVIGTTNLATVSESGGGALQANPGSDRVGHDRGISPAATPEGNPEHPGERPIKLSEVPQKVSQAAQERMEGLELTRAMVETEDGKKFYELKGKANGKVYEIEVSEDGEVVDFETEGDDDDDED